MHLFPTAPAKAVAATAALGVLAGAIFREPIVIIWMGSMLTGVVIMRALSALAVERARRHGFEMYIRSDSRRLSVGRGETFTLTAVIRNRSPVALRLSKVEIIASPELKIRCTITQLNLTANTEADVVLNCMALRVGHFALHGLQLLASQTLGAFDTPLLFINPVQVVVWPLVFKISARQSLGGRSRGLAVSERTSHRSGDSLELRELRAHQSGDPQRKIAWKASARRGILLVRDEELTERQTLWVLLDASLELWSGELGQAPLDEAVDRVASLLRRHIVLGDRVGLGVLAARVLAWTSPDSGSKHMTHLMRSLLCSTQHWDADRCGSDERHVAQLAYEHLHRIEPELKFPASNTEFEQLASLALQTLRRFDFEIPDVFASSKRELALRQYASAMGLVPAYRLQPDRAACDQRLVESIERCLIDKPTRIVLCTVDPNERLLAGIETMRRRLAQRRVRLTLLRIDGAAGLPTGPQPSSQIIADSIRWRLSGMALRTRLQMKRLRIEIEPITLPREPLRHRSSG